MSGDDTTRLPRYPAGGPSGGLISHMQAAAADGDVRPEENGAWRGGGGGGGDDDLEDDWEDEEDSFQLERRMRDRRRARSLPATFLEADAPAHGGEGVRKRVKFADSIGLDLASVKHFNTLEDPQIPTKVLSRFKSFPPRQQDVLGVGFTTTSTPRNVDRLVRCFPEPPAAGSGGGFEARVRELRVCLEKVTITQFDVRGQIRVCPATTSSSSVPPRREVGVRYTFNDWLSHVDAQALPEGGPDPHTAHASWVGERFTFTMYTPPYLDPSSSVHFAVYLRCDEGDFWDNNGGDNYTLKYHYFPSSASASVSAAFHAN